MNQRIKVIKFAERERQSEAAVAELLVPVTHTVREKARHAAATITGWIGEMRLQRKQDTDVARMQLSRVGAVSSRSESIIGKRKARRF